MRTILLCMSLMLGVGLIGCSKTGSGVGVTVVNSYDPMSGPVGTVVTVFGTDLGGSGADVKINGKSVTGLSGDEESIMFTIPAGATTGPITVNGVTAGTFTVT